MGRESGLAAVDQAAGERHLVVEETAYPEERSYPQEDLRQVAFSVPLWIAIVRG
jgi:hypothetical protein